jgi:nuclear pore complex protein Nup133
MAHEIFRQSGSHVDYVEAFFAAYDYPDLAWIYQLGKGRFGAAGNMLLDLAQSDTRLGPVKFLLSMGKLCELTEVDAAGGNGDGDESLVREYDELLDLVDVQQKLRKDLLETIEGVNISFSASIADVGSQNEDLLTKASAITERVTTRLKQDGFVETITLFKRLVGNLVGDKRLGIEDTLDILGLKDNAQQAGFSVGLHLVYESRVSAHNHLRSLADSIIVPSRRT